MTRSPGLPWRFDAYWRGDPSALGAKIAKEVFGDSERENYDPAGFLTGLDGPVIIGRNQKDGGFRASFERNFLNSEVGLAGVFVVHDLLARSLQDNPAVF